MLINRFMLCLSIYFYLKRKEKIMKIITKEQIVQAITQASEEINSNLIQEISETFKTYDENTNIDMNDPTAQIIATVSLIQGKTNVMLEKVLTNLLCE